MSKRLISEKAVQKIIQEASIDFMTSAMRFLKKQYDREFAFAVLAETVVDALSDEMKSVMGRKRMKGKDPDAIFLSTYASRLTGIPPEHARVVIVDERKTDAYSPAKKPVLKRKKS